MNISIVFAVVLALDVELGVGLLWWVSFLAEDVASTTFMRRPITILGLTTLYSRGSRVCCCGTVATAAVLVVLFVLADFS